MKTIENNAVYRRKIDEKLGKNEFLRSLVGEFQILLVPHSPHADGLVKHYR